MAENHSSDEDAADGTYERANSTLPIHNSPSVHFPDDELEIFRAVRYDDIEMVGRQIRSGVDVNVSHEGGKCTLKDRALHRPILTKSYSPLHVAVLHSSLKTINFLLENGADVNAVEGNNQTALHFATTCGRVGVVKRLIEAGADVNVQTSSGKTALMEAVVSNNIDMVRCLLAAGADLELTDIKGGTVLYMCTIFTGKDTRFMQCLIKAGCDVNKTNKQGASALMMAAQLHVHSAVSMLIKAGANVNQADHAGLTPLHPCVENNHNLDMVLYLIQQGADVNWKDRKGKTPLDKTIMNGRLRMMKLLVTADAHYAYSQMTSTRMEELSNYWPPFKEWLMKELSTPRPLQRCCRQVIRDSLGPGRLGPDVINSLCLPTSLKFYLRIKSPELDSEYGLRGPPPPKPKISPSMIPVVPFMPARNDT